MFSPIDTCLLSWTNVTYILIFRANHYRKFYRFLRPNYLSSIFLKADRRYVCSIGRIEHGLRKIRHLPGAAMTLPPLPCCRSNLTNVFLKMGAAGLVVYMNDGRRPVPWQYAVEMHARHAAGWQDSYSRLGGQLTLNQSKEGCMQLRKATNTESARIKSVSK
jgi:hypothetical protein